MRPIITDNDKDEITATLNGREIRGWSYRSDAERRDRMRMAREYVEGWIDALRPRDGVEIVRTLRCSMFHLTEATQLGPLWDASGAIKGSEADWPFLTLSTNPWRDGSSGDPSLTSPEMAAVMGYAIAQGCDRVLFDTDGPELRGFPVFEEAKPC